MGFEKVRWGAKRCRDLSDVLNVCVLGGVVYGIRFPLCFLPQQVLIDARGHLLGRLASIIAKSLLCGECEGVRPFSLIPYHASSQWRDAFILCVSLATARVPQNGTLLLVLLQVSGWSL